MTKTELAILALLAVAAISLYSLQPASQPV